VGLFSRCWDGGCLEEGYLQEKDAVDDVERGRPEFCSLRSITKTAIYNATGELVFYDAWSVCFVADI
jgi:hypothetical protein